MKILDCACKDAGSGESATCGGGSEAVEREDVGKKRVASITLNGIFVGLDIAAAEHSTAFGDPNRVKHAVSVKQVVGPTWKVLRVRAIADVGTVEARRQGALYDLTLGRRKLINRSKVVGEDVFWVHRRAQWRVDEAVNDVIQSVEDHCR